MQSLGLMIKNTCHSPRRHDASCFFPKDVSSQGSSEDCWPISHHTYPTHIHHTTHIPHISIQNVSYQYVSHQYVSVQYVSHQYVSMRCVSIQYVSISYPFKRSASAGMANVSHQYMSHQYVSVQHVSHQYVSIQCVSIQKVCISGNGNVCECKTYPCMSLHQQEWQ